MEAGLSRCWGLASQPPRCAAFTLSEEDVGKKPRGKLPGSPIRGFFGFVFVLIICGQGYIQALKSWKVVGRQFTSDSPRHSQTCSFAAQKVLPKLLKNLQVRVE